MDAQTTCDILRPFGGAAVATGVACTLKPGFESGSGRGAGTLTWTHVLELAETVDIRDGTTRTPGSGSLNFADGDEVRIPDAAGSVYVVVYVERVPTPAGQPGIKRAYLLRDTAVWPGP